MNRAERAAVVNKIIELEKAESALHQSHKSRFWGLSQLRKRILLLEIQRQKLELNHDAQIISRIDAGIKNAGLNIKSKSLELQIGLIQGTIRIGTLAILLGLVYLYFSVDSSGDDYKDRDKLKIEEGIRNREANKSNIVVSDFTPKEQIQKTHEVNPSKSTNQKISKLNLSEFETIELSNSSLKDFRKNGKIDPELVLRTSNTLLSNIDGHTRNLSDEEIKRIANLEEVKKWIAKNVRESNGGVSLPNEVAMGAFTKLLK